jgi:signal transduction histidine kinase
MKSASGQETAFMGKVTASMTHELRNVFAAINETAGLMEDILMLSKDVTVQPHALIPEKLAKIKALVDRGVKLTGTLNALAHAPDESLSLIDLKETVERVISFSERLAAFKGVFPEVSPEARPAFVTTNPLRIQMVLFDCVGLFMEIAGRHGTLLVGTSEGKDGEARVDFVFEEKQRDGKGEVMVPTSSTLWPVLEENVKDLNGRIELKEPPTRFTLVF